MESSRVRSQIFQPARPITQGIDCRGALDIFNFTALEVSAPRVLDNAPEDISGKEGLGPRYPVAVGECSLCVLARVLTRTQLEGCRLRTIAERKVMPRIPGRHKCGELLRLALRSFQFVQS
jgi:hypothetical protein